jgi:hypothetical protein
MNGKRIELLVVPQCPNKSAAAQVLAQALADIGRGSVFFANVSPSVKAISLQQVSTDQVDPKADAAVAATRCGDVAALTQVLTEAPDLARAPVPGYQRRTLLHVATDWPG